MGKCKYNHYKKKCTLDVCCFECKKECDTLEERCFTDDTYEESIIRRYPITCKYYLNK